MARRRGISGGIAAVVFWGAGLPPLGNGADTIPSAADQPIPASENAEPEAAPDARPQRVIVLSTGRVVLGDLVERPGGYLVREQFGSVVIPFVQVRLTAADLPDAYRKLSSALQAPTAGQHLDLAEWCYQNRLYSSAQIEVREALQLEPERKDAREFLRKLQRTLESGAQSEAAPNASTDVRNPSDGLYPGQNWKSYAQRRRQEMVLAKSGGAPAFSPEVVKGFVQQVQPLLINKCGNAHCHGQAATNEFQLTLARQGMSGFRLLTDKNLSSVLRQIDVRDPPASPLLGALDGPHAGSASSVLVGPTAAQQQVVLRNWVLSAAREQARRQPAATEDAGDPDSQRPIAGSTPSADPFLRQILDEERADAFDPEVFNRLVHAQASAPVNNR